MITHGKNGITISENMTLSHFLKGIETDCVESQEKILKEIGNVIKEHIKNNVPVSDRKFDNYKHIKDDVVLFIRTIDGTKRKRVYIRGGKRTGTKWHLLNDGTYRSKATHFMDNALEHADTQAESIIDKHLK